MPLTLGTGLAAAGMSGNLIGGLSAAKAQKEYSRRMAQGVQMQNELFRQAQPYYQQLLQAAAQRAGIGGQGYGPGGVTGEVDRRQFGLGGQYGSVEDQLRLGQAQEDIERYYQQQANQARHKMGATGLMASGLGARLASDQARDYAGFRRGLALNAGQEQERRLGELRNLMGMGFNQGSQAIGGYGQLGAQYGQQANQAFAGLGAGLQNWQHMNALRRYGPQPAGSINDEELLRLLALQQGGTADTYGGRF
jgi:hypothetical protein